MSSSTPTRQQSSPNSSAVSKQSATTSTVYAGEQQEKFLNLQGEVDLLLAQIQAETNLLAIR